MIYKCVIYKITSPSNKIYIGQSKNVNKRFKQYQKMNCKTQKVLLNSLNKYGADNHIFEVIEECAFEDLNIRERYWQEYYNSLAPNGLNSMLTESKDSPRVVSKSTSIKLSESKIGNKNPMYGKKKTDAQKEYLSLKFKGRVFTDEWKRKIQESKIKSGKHKHGKPMSEETKQMLKLALIEKFSGFNNTRSRIVLDVETGIFYYNVNDVSLYNNIHKETLRAMLKGRIKNKTKFIFA
jgi:group I intron endonuclease